MSNRKPMTYISLRTLLQYTDANLRFRLAARCPSVRNAEKAAILKLESLEYENNFFSINKLTYMVTLYQKSRYGETPPQIENNIGLNRSDIDRNGFSDMTGERTVLPGDIVFREHCSVERVVKEADQDKENEEIRRLESEIEDIQLRLVALKEMAPLEEIPVFNGELRGENLRIFNEHLQIFQTGAYAEVPREQLQNPLVERARKTAISRLTYQMDVLHNRLKPRYDRINNVEAPLVSYIQVLISREDEAGNYERIELVEYTAKLHHAIKSIFNFMFGNRKGVVYIKRLVPDHLQIMRMPLGLKIKIRELRVIASPLLMYKRLKAIVDKSSYPLDIVETSQRTAQDFFQPIIRSANKLVIWERQITGGTWLGVYRRLRNPRVDKKSETKDFDYIRVIQSWLDVKREIGTCYTFGFLERETIIALLKQIARGFIGAVFRDNTAIVPMNNVSKIKLSYEEIEEEEERPEEWNLIMEVVPL